MEHTTAQAPSTTKVLLFRQQGVPMLKEAQAAGLLAPEINREVQKLIDRNEHLERELKDARRTLRNLRKESEQQRGAIVQYRRMHLEMYDRWKQADKGVNIDREHYITAILAAVSFFITTCVLTLSMIWTFLS